MRASRGTRAAFTLVELLVVIGIIAVLISILLPALNRARNQAKNVKCMSQLHNLAASVAIYESQNKGKIPVHASGFKPDGTTGGSQCSWMWDIPKATRDALVKQGGLRNTLYCPTQDEQNVDALWDGTFITGQTYDFSVIGYIWMGLRLGPDGKPSTALPTFANTIAARVYVTTSRTPTPDVAPGTTYYRFYPHVPAETELCMDAMISQVGTTTAIPKYWGAKGGWNDEHVSSHLYHGVPTGINILFLDGHVGFRPYKPGAGLNAGTVIKRTSSGSPPIEFWW